MGFLGDLFAPLAGLRVTFRQMFGPRVTVKYPERKRVKPERFHGRHVLNRYPDGMEKCIGCELCAGVCPARCIYVRGAENPPEAPISPGERYGYVYEINMLRCIFCGLCVEACPTEAITMTHLFEFSTTNREDSIYTREDLLMDAEGNIPHPQPEGPLIDLAELKLGDGWLRATSPSGRAAYEGVVAWTPTAGIGLAPAELGQSGEARPDASVEHPEGSLPPSPPPQERGLGDPSPPPSGRGSGGG
ncbi:MAG: NADH-quinone oxidoreductase subunit NuoI [Acidimicrobiia bacterium]